MQEAAVTQKLNEEKNKLKELPKHSKNDPELKKLLKTQESDYPTLSKNELRVILLHNKLQEIEAQKKLEEIEAQKQLDRQAELKKEEERREKEAKKEKKAAEKKAEQKRLKREEAKKETLKAEIKNIKTLEEVTQRLDKARDTLITSDSRYSEGWVRYKLKNLDKTMNEVELAYVLLSKRKEELEAKEKTEKQSANKQVSQMSNQEISAEITRINQELNMRAEKPSNVPERQKLKEQLKELESTLATRTALPGELNKFTKEQGSFPKQENQPKAPESKALLGEKNDAPKPSNVAQMIQTIEGQLSNAKAKVEEANANLRFQQGRGPQEELTSAITRVERLEQELKKLEQKQEQEIKQPEKNVAPKPMSALEKRRLEEELLNAEKNFSGISSGMPYGHWSLPEYKEAQEKVRVLKEALAR